MTISRSTRFAILALGVCGFATPAAATIIFTMATQSSGQGQIVLLNSSTTQGNTIAGSTNQTRDGITFSSSQIIGDPPNGQSLIGAFSAIGGTTTSLNNLAFRATDPLLAFSRVEFDLTNTAGMGDATSVTLFGRDQFGANFSQTFDTRTSGTGAAVGTNWLVGTAINGEVITNVSFNTPSGTGFTDFRHLRVDLARVTPPVPETGTWAMMLLGFGVVGSAMRRRRGARLIRQAA